MTLVQGILSCGCVVRREAAGFSAPATGDVTPTSRPLVRVGDTLWCQNHQAGAVLESLAPVAGCGARA